MVNSHKNNQKHWKEHKRQITVPPAGLLCRLEMALVWPSHLVDKTTRMWTLLSGQISSVIATHPLGKIKIVYLQYILTGAGSPPLWNRTLLGLLNQTQGLKGTVWVPKQSWATGHPEPRLLLCEFMPSLPAVRSVVATPWPSAWANCTKTSSLHKPSHGPRVNRSTRLPLHRSTQDFRYGTFFWSFFPGVTGRDEKNTKLENNEGWVN